VKNEDAAPSKKAAAAFLPAMASAIQLKMYFRRKDAVC
jgi:hypothetical protein